MMCPNIQLLRYFRDCYNGISVFFKRSFYEKKEKTNLLKDVMCY